MSTLVIGGTGFGGVQSVSPGSGGVLANNGLSEDATTPGIIVLGQGPGEIGDPAQLLGPRELPMVTNPFKFLGRFGWFFEIDPAGVFNFTSDNIGNGNELRFARDGSTATPFSIFVQDNGVDETVLFFGSFIAMIKNTVTGEKFLVNVGANKKDACVLHSLSFDAVVFPLPAGTYAFGTAEDSAVRFTNEGAGAAVIIDLGGVQQQPVGAVVIAYVQEANSLQLLCHPAETIRIGASVSSAGGTATSSAVGSFIRLIKITAAEWIAESELPAGAWVLA